MGAVGCGCTVVVEDFGEGVGLLGCCGFCCHDVVFEFCHVILQVEDVHELEASEDEEAGFLSPFIERVLEELLAIGLIMVAFSVMLKPGCMWFHFEKQPQGMMAEPFGCSLSLFMAGIGQERCGCVSCRRQ